MNEETLVSKSLGLAVTDRQKPSKGAFNIRPKKVEKWLAELPKANVGETAKLVFHTLIETNQLKYSHKERARFLEELRPTTQFVTTAMRKHFVGTSFPLPKKSQKVASATREIYLQLAQGYIVCIEDLLRSSILFTDKKLLVTLIHRAISCLGRVLLTSYQVYSPYPNKVWSKLNKLYAYAEAHKLLKQEVLDNQRLFIKKSTIAEEYSRVLLLSLASPYRLRQGEVHKVHNTLERWTIKNNLFSIKQNEKVHGCFAINLKTDAPPRNIALVNNDCNPDDCRTLDTERLAETIRDEIQNTHDATQTTITGIEMASPELSHDLLRRLLTAWAVIAKRNFPRSEKHERVQVAVGLSASHQIISDSVKRNTPETTKATLNSTNSFSRKSHFDTAEVNSLNVKQPDVWNLVYPKAGSGYSPLDAKKISKIVGTQNSDDIDELLYHAESWAILNESASGYCIQNKNKTETTVQVGELVSVRRNGNGQTWKWGVGVIRWMKHSNDIGLTLGVEMLTPNAAAVGVKTAIDDSDIDYQRTLMLPQLNAINQASTIITNPVSFRIGNQLKLKIMTKEINIKLSKQLQNTGLFAQYQYDILDSKPSEEDHRESSDENDFNQVWSII